jgi:ABC-type Zn uptake system ZnuABC Zn-binding protein ZnuA
MKYTSLVFTLFVLMVALKLDNIKAQNLNVITTLPSLASITESVGGEYVDVYSITRGVQDAHYIEAKPSYMIKLNKADLLIYSGLELEIGWLPLLIQGARNTDVSVGARGNLNASLAIQQETILERPRGQVDRTMGDVHPLGNPHYLLEPNHGLSVAGLIADKLIELDPGNQDAYLSNLDAYQNILRKKISELESKAAILKDLELVCYHVHWSYLLNWLGIKSAGYIELRPGIPPTPRHKREIIEMMKRRNIKIVIISSWKEPTKAQEVAHAVGAKLIILPGEVNALSNTNDYVSWLDYMVVKLVDTAMPVGLEKNIQQQKRIRKQSRGKND